MLSHVASSSLFVAERHLPCTCVTCFIRSSISERLGCVHALVTGHAVMDMRLHISSS